MVHNFKFPICHHRFLKPSYLANHRSRGHKNTPPFRNLITSATDSLSSLISFSNFDDTKVAYIIFNSEDTNMASDTGNYISGNEIDSETA